MNRNVFLLPALLPMACALPETVWNKPGVTQEQYASDSNSCEDQVKQANLGIGTTAGVNKKAFYERCMEQLGYVKQGEVENPRRKDTTAPGVLAQ